MWEALPADSGPEYPRELGKDIASFRKLGRHGLRELSIMARRGYGNAVLTAIRGKQKQALQRELPSHNVHCASGTNHSTGREILKAVAAQHRAASLAKGAFHQALANEKYEAAMKAKHGAIEWKEAA
jgi:hypothetical protein